LARSLHLDIHLSADVLDMRPMTAADLNNGVDWIGEETLQPVGAFFVALPQRGRTNDQAE
jgi:hypothetical protein